MLDPHAVVRLLRSDLPVAIYPCATKDGPFAYGPHNCFWRTAGPEIRRPHGPAASGVPGVCLHAVDADGFPAGRGASPAGGRARHVHRPGRTTCGRRASGPRWPDGGSSAARTAVAAWLRPARSCPATGSCRTRLRPCRVKVRDDGKFAFELCEGPTNFLIYDRGDPHENEKALRDALPRFTPPSASRKTIRCRKSRSAASSLTLDPVKSG